MKDISRSRLSACGPVGDVRRGLTLRMVIASSLLALIVCAVFTIMLVAIGHQRDSATRATHSRAELSGADRLEKLVIDQIGRAHV